MIQVKPKNTNLKAIYEGVLSNFGFLGGSVVKNPPADARRRGFAPWVGKRVEGNGNPPQCSFLETPMDRGAWWAIVHDVVKSQTQLSD